jgi:hypothetical protein
MSDGGRARPSLGVEMWKPSQKWSEQRSAVRSIAGLDGDHGVFAASVLIPSVFSALAKLSP